MDPQTRIMQYVLKYLSVQKEPKTISTIEKKLGIEGLHNIIDEMQKLEWIKEKPVNGYMKAYQINRVVLKQAS